MDLTAYRELKEQRMEALARDVIDEARVALMLKFRFLDLALWRMELESFPIPGGYALATDGKKIYFDGELVLARFEESFDELVRDYLHIIMHCLFRHPFDNHHDDKDAWWLTASVLAESAAMELCGSRFESDLDQERKTALSELRLVCGGTLSPGRLYNELYRAYRVPLGTVYKGLTPGRLNELLALFERDNHEAWPAYAKGMSDETPGDIEELPTPSDEGDKSDIEAGQDLRATANEEAMESESLKENPDNSSSDDEEGATGSFSEDLEQESDEAVSGEEIGSASEKDEDQEIQDQQSSEERDWEEIAKSVEMNLETFSKEWGEEAGGLIALLKVANRKRYDYSEFLRKFAMLSEEMKINDDEYDYIFYTYGLDLYGNMPLIEPLEYKETERIRDFVIALDTSESCSGDLIKRFLSHTFDMLKAQEDFAHAINVHIIQCDAKIQADTIITDLRDVDHFMDGFYIRGLGGTDFRPVFAYVEDLRHQGELSDLKGLIYFTDGLGTYPEKAPEYQTAFVFMDAGDNLTPKVPPWAIKVVLDEEGIKELKN